MKTFSEIVIFFEQICVFIGKAKRLTGERDDKTWNNRTWSYGGDS